MRCFFLLLLLLVPFLAGAFTYEAPLADTAQERRAQELFSTIRCVVCVGQTIRDSDADLAVTLRHTIHKMVAEGISDAEIQNFLIDRYGDAVILAPPVRGSTYLLWFGPLIFLALALLVVMFRPTMLKRKS